VNEVFCKPNDEWNDDGWYKTTKPTKHPTKSPVWKDDGWGKDGWGDDQWGDDEWGGDGHKHTNSPCEYTERATLVKLV